mgnify:CR=1 FL=1
MRLLACLVTMLVVGRAAAQAFRPAVLKVGLYRAKPPVQVAVGCSRELVVSAGGRTTRLSPPRTLSVRAVGSRIAITGPGLPATAEGAVFRSETGQIRIDGRSFRGSVRIRANGGRLVIVNDVGLEDYVRAVVPNEMRSDWPAEALKCQAVVARTLAAARLGRHASQGFDLCDTTHCQVYRGSGFESARASAAAAATAGQVLAFAGRPIEAFYCSTCGGISANTLGARPIRSVPYLRVRKDILHGATACKESPHYSWRSRLDRSAVASALGGPVTSIRVASRDVSGRARLVVLRGCAAREMDASEFMNTVCRKLGWATIKSTMFSVACSGTFFTFTGHGLGHGIGLCQWGAKKRAESGWGYGRILQFYYPGARVQPLRNLPRFDKLETTHPPTHIREKTRNLAGIGIVRMVGTGEGALC